MSDLGIALGGLLATYDHYHTADAYFQGRQPEVFTSAKLAYHLRHAGMRFRLNYARVPVTSVLNRLEISAVSCSADSRANAALQVIWDDNQMDLWSNDLHRDGLSFGDTYLHIWPDEGGFPELHLSGPLTTKLIYDPQYTRRKKAAITTWIEPDKRARADLYYPDRIERYSSRGECTHLPDNPKEWEPYVDEQSGADGVLDNPYGQIPFFHFRTDRPYGRPEHYDSYGAQDAINKHVTQEIANNDFQSFPQRYLLSEMGGSAIPTVGGTSDDDPWSDEDEIPVATSDNGNVSSPMRTGPGSILEFIGQNLRIGEFAASNPGPAFIEPIRMYIQSISDTTDTPIHMFRSMGDVPSGEALRAADAPLTKKARDRAISFGASWKEALEFALGIVGIEADVEVTWRDPQIVDSKDLWETIALKLAAGVPLEVCLQEAGYSVDAIAAWQDQTPVDSSVDGSTAPTGDQPIDAPTGEDVTA